MLRIMFLFLAPDSAFAYIDSIRRHIKQVQDSSHIEAYHQKAEDQIVLLLQRWKFSTEVVTSTAKLLTIDEKSAICSLSKSDNMPIYNIDYQQNTKCRKIKIFQFGHWVHY